MRLLDTTKALSLGTVTLVAVLAFSLASCSDSSVGTQGFDEQLEITGVQWQSPDSSGTPEELNPGDLVALQGNNMNSVAQVFFNGIEVEFNPALASERYLIVSVPNDLPFGGLDPESEEFNTIRVANQSSEAQMDFPVLPPPPELQEMSNEHASPGDEVTLYGQFLYLTESITFPNDVTIGPENLDAADDGSSVTFTLPQSVSIEANSNVSITTAAGSDTSAPAFLFHDKRGMLLNWDDHASWQFWNATVATSSDSEFGSGAEGSFGILQAGSEIPVGDNAWYSSNRTVNLNNQQWVAPENLGEPPENFAVKFELNIAEEWSTGNIIIHLHETTENYQSGYGYRIQPWRQSDGSVSAVNWQGWRTFTVPLSQFRDGYGSPDGSTAPDLVALLGEDGKAGSGGPDNNPSSFRLNNIGGNSPIPASQAFAVDNIRVVRISEAE